MKHYCIFEITQPNKKSKSYKATFVNDFDEDYNSADEFCQSLNNFKPKNVVINFILRCLEQEEFETIQNFLKTNRNGDISEVYSPFLQKIVLNYERR